MPWYGDPVVPDTLLLWVIFNIFVLGMLTLDLAVFHRKAHKYPDESLIGIILAIVSLIIMPLLAFYRLAAEINSRALGADALEILACSYLSLTLLLGLGANALFGWWWADPVAALAMVYFLIKEGLEAISEGRGEVAEHDCSVQMVMISETRHGFDDIF